MQSKKAIFLCLLFVAFLIPSPVHAETVTQTRYFTANQNMYFFPTTPYGILDIYQDYSVMGGDYWTTNKSGNRAVQWSSIIFILDNYGIPTQISDAYVAIVERPKATGTQEGYQSVLWTCPDIQLSRNQSIYVECFTRDYVVSWSVWAYYTTVTYSLEPKWSTEGLGMQNITSSDWNFTYYTYRSYTTQTMYRFYFGDESHASRIENIQLDDGISERTSAWYLSGAFAIGFPLLLALIIAAIILVKHK